MPPLPTLRAVLLDPRLRVALASVTALCWFLLAIAWESGRNAAPVVIVGVPAMLVLFWWRRYPARALALSTGALVLVGLTAWLASPQHGVLIAVSTVWFAVLGASASAEQRVRWAGGAVAGLYALVALLTMFGYGGASGFLFVAFMLALAVGAGWAWRQVVQTDRLRSTLAQSRVRVDAAERDVVLEVERNRIAREVHDVVAHSLAVVIAQADGARFAAEAKPESVAPALDAIADTARRALGEVRTMLHDLRTSGEGSAPGADDLGGLLDGVRGLGVEVEEASFGEPRDMSRDAGLALYRVAQEALTNAVRHGDRTRPIGFEVDWGEREVVLAVTNALPETAVPATERAGHGVEGMLARAADAGGDCTAGAGSNGRFRVRVALPVAPPRPAQPEQQPVVNPLVALFRADAEARAS